MLKNTVKQITNTRKIYDPTKPPIFIPYFDMNSLYDCGMSDYLPHKRWLKNVDNFDVNSIIEKSPIGYII